MTLQTINSIEQILREEEKRCAKEKEKARRKRRTTQDLVKELMSEIIYDDNFQDAYNNCGRLLMVASEMYTEAATEYQKARDARRDFVDHNW